MQQRDEDRLSRAYIDYLNRGGEVKRVATKARRPEPSFVSEFLDHELVDGAAPTQKCWCWK